MKKLIGIWIIMFVFIVVLPMNALAEDVVTTNTVITPTYTGGEVHWTINQLLGPHPAGSGYSASWSTVEPGRMLARVRIDHAKFGRPTGALTQDYYRQFANSEQGWNANTGGTYHPSAVYDYGGTDVTVRVQWWTAGFSGFGTPIARFRVDFIRTSNGTVAWTFGESYSVQGTPGATWWTLTNPGSNTGSLLRRQTGSSSSTTSTTVHWAPRANNTLPSPASGTNNTNSTHPSTIVISRNIALTTGWGPHELVTWVTGGPQRLAMSPSTTNTLARSTFVWGGTTFPVNALGRPTTIGRWTPSIRATDGHSDATTANTQITIFSSDELLLDIDYGNSALIPAAIRGVAYDVNTAFLPCGGEDGWTRFPLTFTAGNPAWPGNAYQRNLTSNVGTSFTVTNTTGNAVRTNYHTNTASVGNTASAHASVIGNPSTTLSATQTKSFRIDATPPVANVTHNGGTSFTCASTDALSGISPTRRTKVALVMGSAIPADNDYHELDAVPSQPPGTYTLWVWATDRAGNEHKVQRGTIEIEGGISIIKDTNLGATLHADTCMNSTQITTPVTCTPACQIGASAELMGETEITYILRLKNDSTNNASGTFSDVLPEGFVPIGMPTSANIVGSGGISSVSNTLNGKRWTVAGNFNLSANTEIEIRIRGTLPAFDTTVGASNIVQNQASITWQLGTGASAINGTSDSNYANHRINANPTIHKASNWGAAIHVDTCANAGSLTTTGTCNAACVAGNPGTVQEGDVITYRLTFHNQSNALLYFATDALANYDLMPMNLNMTGQTYSVTYSDENGITNTPWSGNVSASGTILNQASPYTDGTFVDGLIMRDNRIFQQANSAISIGPGAKVVITVAATVSGDVGDVLSNQVVSGFSTTGSNTANLRLTHAGVETIKSNYATHHIERGTVLRKWAYSDTSAANNPAIHAAFCTNRNSMITLAGCTAGACANGTASLQEGNIVTYALTMDNSQYSHAARNLNGIIIDMGGSVPGLRMNYHHLDNQIPEGLTPDATTMRVYVADKDGNNIKINNGGAINSSLQAVNENGTMQMREVLNLSAVGTHTVFSTGTGTMIFQLQNLNLYKNGTQWVWETNNNHFHSQGSQHNQGTFSITYLVDAEVTGVYDESVALNNLWNNHWEQHNPWSVNNPETGNVVIPPHAMFASNSVLQMRATDSVETLFTKVGADALTIGLAGAEFALYCWEGTQPPTDIERNHMVNPDMLVDNTLLGGDWVRVTHNGQVATSVSDVFVSATVPQGEVDFGKLEDGIYTLIETKAPMGYELPMGQWILTIRASNTNSGANDWKIEFVGKSHSLMPPAAIRDETVLNAPTYRLINARPFSIGMSGLGGTRGMLLLGFVLMTVAGNAYIVYNYKQRKRIKQE